MTGALAEPLTWSPILPFFSSGSMIRLKMGEGSTMMLGFMAKIMATMAIPIAIILVTIPVVEKPDLFFV